MERIPESEAIAEPVDARRFNEVMGSNRFRLEGYRQLARRAVDAGILPGGKVLDMGTGPGFVAIEVARLLIALSWPNTTICKLDSSFCRVSLSSVLSLLVTVVLPSLSDSPMARTATVAPAPSRATMPAITNGILEDLRAGGGECGLACGAGIGGGCARGSMRF